MKSYKQFLEHRQYLDFCCLFAEDVDEGELELYSKNYLGYIFKSIVKLLKGRHE